MNILRIFGIVAAIHVFALLLIFANPGCSATKAAPSAAMADAAPAPKPDAVPTIAMPVAAPADAAPATPAPASPGALYSPIRPGTPAAAAIETQPVSDVTPASSYSVGRGDSLWSIAKKNHLRVSELASANGLKAGATLHLGQKLLIPSKAMPASGDAAPAPAAASTKAAAPAKSTAHAATTRGSGESSKYVVRSGETLGAIAHKFGVRVGDLATANSISDPQKIHAGQEITIPAGGHASAGKSSKSQAKTASAAPAASAPADMAPAQAATPDIGPPPAPAAPADIPLIKIDGASDASSPSTPSK